MSKRDCSKPPSTVVLQNEKGETFRVIMRDEGGEALGVIYIDGVPYHEEVGCGGMKFIVDRDPAYRPRLGPSGQCLLIAPYLK